jgi:hypothetical protein
MYKKIQDYLKILLLPGLLLVSSSLFGQAETKWLNIGDMWHKLSATGAEPEVMRNEGLIYPALAPFDRFHSHYNRKHLWIATESHTDEDGTVYAPRVVHTGDRVFNLDEFYPKPMQLISKYEPTDVVVDGLPSFRVPVQVTKVDPSINADRIVVREANTAMGVNVRNVVRAWANEYHNDYMIHEYVFTNNGNADLDEEVEYPDQVLEGVIISFLTKYQHINWTIPKSGTVHVTDAFGDGINETNDYPMPYRSQVIWYGRVPWDVGSSFGQPAIASHPRLVEGDTLGRLAVPEFITRTTLHADTSPTDNNDDQNQPVVMGNIRGGDPITNGHDFWEQKQMTEEYQYVHPDMAWRDYGVGTHDPDHADIITGDPASFGSWHERMAAQTDYPNMGHDGGWPATISFGPYTLNPGDSLRIVYVEGFAGLGYDAAFDIGRAYKLSGYDDNFEITYQDSTMTKDLWYFTGIDSIKKMLDMASAVYDAGYAVPEPPKPPQNFTVTSGTDRITLSWETFNDENPPGGFVLYRTRNQYHGEPEKKFIYDEIATLDPSDRSYEDTEVTRGIQYYYYLQAVGDVNQDNTGLTPTGVRLKSGRYYTQTYTPGFLKREPGQTIGDVRVVPNPYNLGSSNDVRWPGQQDRIGFLDVPGQCDIEIYTELGELVEEIAHTDGSGDEYWDLTTKANQVVVSGLYFAVIKDRETGDQLIRKFIIMR